MSSGLDVFFFVGEFIILPGLKNLLVLAAKEN
jgi:hypothetical protein